MDIMYNGCLKFVFDYYAHFLSAYFTSVSYTSGCSMYFLMNGLMAQQVIQPTNY